ncbi:hypothetical protein BU15DRAFT_78512 [Melanogaster broomeanus]|nr:hypothetical protein BU15DRAFT_78512 [Melanogaster broomeanus]
MSSGAQDASPTPSPTNLHTTQGHTEGCFQRRLRHITSIQIRNLTPFPVRDAFASALSQPATHSQFTPLGNLSDDLDVTLLRRRSRRISTTSVNTLKNFPADDITSALDDLKGSGEGGPASGIGSSVSRSMTTGTSALVARQSRMRAASGVSSNGVSASQSSGAAHGSVVGIPSASTLYFDHSQRTLEKIIKSRLVETFITITVPESPSPSPSPPTINGQPRSRAESGPSHPSPIDVAPLGDVSTQTARNKVSRTSLSASMGATKTLLSRVGPSTATRSPTPTRKPQPMAKAASSSSGPRPALKTHRPSSSVPLQKTSSHQSSLPLPSPIQSRLPPKVPDYISPIHPPIYESNSHIRRFNSGQKPRPVPQEETKAKQKESDSIGASAHGPGWNMLEEWNIRLLDLIPISLELENHPSHLPSNTLVVSFMPTGQSFYFAPPSRSRSRSHSRSPSPSGYSTDPESEVRKLSQTSQAIPPPSSAMTPASDNISQLTTRRSRKLGARTASSQELLELVTMQACILEAEESLRDVIREIDTCLAQDSVTTLKREASERQERIRDRQAEARAMKERSNCLRDNIASRRLRIQVGRENLAKGRALQSLDKTSLSEKIAEVTEQRNNLTALRNRLPTIRTSLISRLSTIYPIELLSSSELLFTILAVPLPIPFNSNEPAPPLSLSTHKEVTEDAVATALGYAAHLIQLLALYMGKGLVYPITYIGSRSLIRDNISAMVGPRMFPLFSKGVDTYRFEYAVFLLNKDIEMLMADRDLRALDMRHTLPNLKNLLLTLTDGECASLYNPRYDDSPSSAGLATPPPGRSPPSCVLELPQENTPSNCSPTTPIATSTTDRGRSTLSRYSKISLGFPPLPDFLRSRNPSTFLRSPVKSVPDGLEDAEETNAPTGTLPSSSGFAASAGGPDEDDDRRTIRGVTVDHTEQTASPEVKEAGNGHAAGRHYFCSGKAPRRIIVDHAIDGSFCRCLKFAGLNYKTFSVLPHIALAKNRSLPKAHLAALYHQSILDGLKIGFKDSRCATRLTFV